MWMFEQSGFYSVVAYDPTKDKFAESAHKDLALASDDPKGGFLLIRARMIEDLEVMEEIVGHEIFIQTDQYADYSFRAIMTRDQFKAYLALAVDRIDYGAHFKEASRDATAKKSPVNAAKKYSAMMSVWSIMAGLQPYIPYAGTVRGGSVSNKGWSGWSGGSSSTKDSKVTSVTTSAGTTYYGSEDTDYRGDEFYDSLFNGTDSAREDGWGSTVVHDADEEEWYNYAGVPITKATATAVKTANPTANIKVHTAAKASTTVTTTKIPEFEASAYWFTLPDLGLHLTRGGTLSNLTDEDIDSMPEDVWEMWAAAVKVIDPTVVLSEEEIVAQFGVSALEFAKEEESSNESD